MSGWDGLKNFVPDSLLTRLGIKKEAKDCHPSDTKNPLPKIKLDTIRGSNVGANFLTL